MLNYDRRCADDRTVIGHILDNNAVCTNADIAAHPDSADDLCARTDVNIVPDLGESGFFAVR